MASVIAVCISEKKGTIKSGDAICVDNVICKEPFTGHTDSAVAVKADTVFCLRIQRILMKETHCLLTVTLIKGN